MLERDLGMLGGALVILAGLPQLLTVIRARNISGVSLGTFAIYALSGLVWMGYGIMRRDAAIYVTNIFVLINGLAILGVVAFRRNGME